MKTKPWAMLMVLLATLMIASAQIFLKKGANVLSFDLTSLLTNYSLIIGATLYFISAGVLIISLKYGELSVLYPIIALSYIWVSLLSPRFFPEDSMNVMKWFGVGFIAIGVSFIGYGSKE